MILRASFAAATVALLACAPKHNIENPSPFDEDDPRATGDTGGPDTDEPDRDDGDEGALDPGDDDPEEPGTIARADLEVVLANGPGPYMAGVEVDPVTDPDDAGVLHGWRVVRWDYRWVDLRVGDVVLTVNGVAIVRPDDVDDLWSALAAATELDIRIERDGRAQSLAFTIMSPEAAAPAD